MIKFSMFGKQGTTFPHLTLLYFWSFKESQIISIGLSQEPLNFPSFLFECIHLTFVNYYYYKFTRARDHENV